MSTKSSSGNNTAADFNNYVIDFSFPLFKMKNVNEFREVLSFENGASEISKTNSITLLDMP
jgi:hypothetical protein